MAIEIEFDVNKLNARLTKRLDRSQKELAIQVLKDSNYFCPEDAGTLQMSGTIKNNNTIEWDQKYAQSQYYTDNKKSKDRNPNASYKWFERAKAEFKKQWERLTNDKYNS